ncbi:DUF1501 domain-containing protein [Brevundimonas sp. VNH65]|uniref:DUF1501 domain-containing protein n=1 Tax=Brevundimonas sp. VNH65 TaxID=3400917 RepID=UPI003C11E770
MTDFTPRIPTGLSAALDRRRLLRGLTVGGLGLAFAGQAPLQALARSSGERAKFVAIIARGAMDGLSVTAPHDDPAYVALRGGLALPPPTETGGTLALTQGFGLHPALKGLHQAYGEGRMRFAPAVAIPTRVRSHFDAQDMLESGGERLHQSDTGWLNRALAAAGGRGLSIGAQTPLILRGPAESSSWAPGGRIGGDERLAALLQDLYVEDQLLATSLARGLETEALAESGLMAGAGPRRGDVAALAGSVARLMTGETGADVVALSIDGWDTHARQAGQLQARLTQLDLLISGLKQGLGEEWARTIVMVATEFGRTARVNGTQGTDHGTASTLLLTGGAVKQGGPIGDWPGLSDAALFEDRDLAPTLDIRGVFKGVLRDHLGVDRAALDRAVFPDSAAEAPAVSGLV